MVKITCYVTTSRRTEPTLGPIGGAYRDVFGRHNPATTLLGVAALFDPEAIAEMDCEAVAR